MDNNETTDSNVKAGPSSSKWAQVSVKQVLQLKVRPRDDDDGEEREMEDMISFTVQDTLRNLMSQGVQTPAEWGVDSTMGTDALQSAINSVPQSPNSSIKEIAVFTETTTQNLEGNTGDEEVIFEPETQGPSNGKVYTYLKGMNAICVSPFAVAKDGNLGIWGRTKQVMSSVVSLLSVTQSLRVAKHHTLLFLRKGSDVGAYVNAAYYWMRTVTKLGFLYIFTFKQPEVREVVDGFQEVAMHREAITKKRKSHYLSKFMILACLLMTLGRNFFGGYDFEKKWTLEENTNDVVMSFGRGIFAWSGKTFDNDTEWIDDNFIANTTTATHIMAGSGTALDCCGWAQDNFGIDFLMILSIEFHEEVAAFVQTILIEGASAAGTPEERRRKLLWIVAIKRLTEAINIAFGLFLVHAHGNNLYLLAMIILSQVNHEKSVYILMRAFSGIKIVITYIYNLKTRLLNEPILDWLKKNIDIEGVTDANGQVVSVTKLIKEIEEEPIALGYSGTRIDVGFVIQFSMAVVSLFLFMAGIQDKMQACMCECQNCTVAI